MGAGRCHLRSLLHPHRLSARQPAQQAGLPGISRAARACVLPFVAVPQRVAVHPYHSHTPTQPVQPPASGMQLTCDQVPPRLHLVAGQEHDVCAAAVVAGMLAAVWCGDQPGLGWGGLGDRDDRWVGHRLLACSLRGDQPGAPWNGGRVGLTALWSPLQLQTSAVGCVPHMTVPARPAAGCCATANRWQKQTNQLRQSSSQVGVAAGGAQNNHHVEGAPRAVLHRKLVRHIGLCEWEQSL